MLWMGDSDFLQTYNKLIHDQVIQEERALISLPDIKIHVVVTEFYSYDRERFGRFYVRKGAIAKDLIIVSHTDFAEEHNLVEIAEGFSLGICPHRFSSRWKAPIVYAMVPSCRIKFVNN